uniref:Translation elongation factor EFTu-like domain-containing protein n=1 Tax=Arcella intermedia TaxID=1963864 RepID=A0A6B2L973_9EUKA
MEMMSWNQQRFEEISELFVQFCLDYALFRVEQVTFIPVSGWSGENVVLHALPRWYSGPTLWEALQMIPKKNGILPRPLYPVFGPLRVDVKGVYRNVWDGEVLGSGYKWRDGERCLRETLYTENFSKDGQRYSGVVVGARIVSGTIHTGQVVTLWPPLYEITEMAVLDLFVVSSKGTRRLPYARSSEEVILSLQYPPGSLQYKDSLLNRCLRNTILTFSQGPMPDITCIVVFLQSVPSRSTPQKRVLRPGMHLFAICGSKRLHLKVKDVAKKETTVELMQKVFVIPGEVFFVLEDNSIIFEGTILTIK